MLTRKITYIQESIKKIKGRPYSKIANSHWVTWEILTIKLFWFITIYKEIDMVNSNEIESVQVLAVEKWKS